MGDDPRTTTHLNYSLSLLGPRATAAFAADGRSAFRAGIGHCGATVSGYPDFTPAILGFWGGRHHRVNVADPAEGKVRVTAYEARVHFTRQFHVPGVLGRPASSCPMP